MADTEHTIINPPGRLNMPPWREIWRAREVAVRLAQRDIIVRYRQTIFGVTWVLLQPLVTAGVFTIVFGVIAYLESDGIPTFIFTLSAMLAWNLFNGAVGQASASMVANQSLVQKVFFPRILVLASSLASIVVDFLVGFALLIVLLFVFGIVPGWGLLMLPVWVVLILMFGLGLGLMAAAYMVKYRDVGYVLPWVLQVLMYASPWPTPSRRSRRACAGCSRPTRSHGSSKRSGGPPWARTFRPPGRWSPWAQLRRWFCS
ncbi:ABC transporter permease [Nesterenkonia pannonica]|uniref:ABC transporter permease n=1 Tax=Nesterenkonia pannonica TaxID=1548602 RepID=UPI002164CCE9|nr:ABC transporter permease [Nesterenkonia pannonica]